MPQTMTKDKPDYSKGLEGVVAAETGLSLVDGARSQLFYRGIPIHELAEQSSFEETVYLLWQGKLPKAKELEAFSSKLSSYRPLPASLTRILKEISPKMHPMGVLRSLVSILASEDTTADQFDLEVTREQAYRLTAILPTIIAAFFRIRDGKEPIAPDPKLSHAANFLTMMHGEKPQPEMERALDAYLILLADHGLNASTFAARVTTATQSDLYSGVTSAIGTLKGDLHGSANQRAMEMILDIEEPNKAEGYAKNLLEQKKKVMGFGHRIYKKKDPRAVAFRGIAKKMCERAGQNKWMDISDVVEKTIWDAKKIPCNVDFYSASVLYILGFPVDFFTTIFAASRVSGWCAHVMEQRVDNRLIRPGANYTGPKDQSYVPINKR